MGIAGRHLRGTGLEAGQLAGESGGAANRDPAFLRHLVDTVTCGEH